ncbi:hypothetical protein [Parvularcula marina]|uniref:hypothetical protein n=1 Tax=Parvularcula marina TaxID=2292771 RepID=UPI00351890BE
MTIPIWVQCLVWIIACYFVHALFLASILIHDPFVIIIFMIPGSAVLLDTMLLEDLLKLVPVMTVSILSLTFMLSLLCFWLLQKRIGYINAAGTTFLLSHYLMTVISTLFLVVIINQALREYDTLPVKLTISPISQIVGSLSNEHPSAHAYAFFSSGIRCHYSFKLKGFRMSIPDHQADSDRYGEVKYQRMIDVPCDPTWKGDDNL